MNNSTLLLLSFSVGVMVVIQGGINSRLGILLNNSLLATLIALTMAASFTLIAVLSFLAVTLFYYVIPKVGISTAVTFGLAGQLLFAAIAGHFGWFNMPLEPFTMKKIAGLFMMIAGVILIKI